MAITFPGPVPKEAIAFLKNKGLKPGFSYLDVWREEHGYSFTVAKAMQMDVLESIRGELLKALGEGRTFAQFKKDLTPALQRLGWWGQKEMTDPLTGEVKEVNIGPRRLKVIYDTNMRQARAAGQWQRAERTKQALPYLKYELGPSKEHREEHAAWNGLILPVDDPWWNTHMPQNGWGCNCGVRQVSRWEFEKTGKRLSNPPPENPREWVNKRTGEVTMVPEGIDPGFDFNPGKNRMQASLNMMTGKLNASNPDISRVAIKDLFSRGIFTGWAAEPLGDFPVAVMTDRAIGLIGALVRGVRLSPETFAKQQRMHPELDTYEYSRIQDTIDRGQEIQDSKTSLVYILEDKNGYVSVVNATKTGKAIFLKSFRRLSNKEAKRNDEIARLIKKGT